MFNCSYTLVHIQQRCAGKSLGEGGHRKTAMNADFPPKQVMYDCGDVMGRCGMVNMTRYTIAQ